MKCLKYDLSNRVKALAIVSDDVPGEPVDFWDETVPNDTEVGIGWTKEVDGTFTPPSS